MGPKLAANPILLENERFWETVLDGRGAMPPWREALSPQEIADILAWLKTLE
jgi:cytochrome c oxidase cbb3-type subunit 3